MTAHGNNATANYPEPRHDPPAETVDCSVDEGDEMSDLSIQYCEAPYFMRFQEAK